MSGGATSRTDMHIITSVAEMTAVRDALTGTVGLVPTMGRLHDGHLSLVRRARADNDHVVVSIFVNPTQFGPGEDFEGYPRDEKRDVALLDAEGVDIVFVPTVDEMYPPGFDDWVEVTGPIAERLEGAHRPGHFRGVTTVCARLFRITRPDRAYFGQKDAQQLRIVRRMVQEQGLSVEIVPMPIIREPDGLAMSSRNVYLSPEERKAALALWRGLTATAGLVAEGATDAAHVRSAVINTIASEPLLNLDYASVSDEKTLEELSTIYGPTLVLVAARVGKTRLIDNTALVPKGMLVPSELQPLMSQNS